MASIRKINEEVEALRGIAIIAVIISHIGNLIVWDLGIGPTMSSYGFASGVDLFFVISGFVITAAFYEKLSNAAARSPREFWRESRIFMMRRVFRIMPAALIWLLIVCAASAWFNDSGIFGAAFGNLIDTASVLLNVSNFHFAKCIADGYSSHWCGYNGVYWSISLEEQFYLLFPLLILAGKRWVMLLTIAVFVTLALVDRTIYVWYTRVDGILLGICIAFLLRRLTTNRSWRGAPKTGWTHAAHLTAVGVAIAIVPFLMHWELTRYPEAITLLCGVPVVLAAFDRGYSFPAGMVRRVVAYVGSRSFSLYLVHNPVFWLAKEVAFRCHLLDAHQLPVERTTFAVLALVSVFAIAEASYRIIEVPFREWGRSMATGGSKSSEPIEMKPAA